MKISVITPNFNCAKFLEQTILSVLENDKEIEISTPNNPTVQGSGSQPYELEYIVIDGGSTDGSVEIIKKYEARITYWESNPDNGHFHAINKGLQKASGEIMCWINSDDMLASGALRKAASIFETFREVDWIIGNHSFWNEAGELTETKKCRAYARRYLEKGEHDARLLHGVQQESCIWRSRLWQKAGGTVDLTHGLAGDF